MNPNNSVVVPILKNHHREKNHNQGIGETKRSHVFEILYSDKEASNISRNNELAIVTTTPSLGAWQKVQKKKEKKKKPIYIDKCILFFIFFVAFSYLSALSTYIGPLGQFLYSLVHLLYVTFYITLVHLLYVTFYFINRKLLIFPEEKQNQNKFIAIGVFYFLFFRHQC